MVDWAGDVMVNETSVLFPSGAHTINGEVVSEAMRVDELPRGRREKGARIPASQGWKKGSHRTRASCLSQIMGGYPEYLLHYLLK